MFSILYPFLLPSSYLVSFFCLVLFCIKHEFINIQAVSLNTLFYERFYMVYLIFKGANNVDHKCIQVVIHQLLWNVKIGNMLIFKICKTSQIVCGPNYYFVTWIIVLLIKECLSWPHSWCSGEDDIVYKYTMSTQIYMHRVVIIPACRINWSSVQIVWCVVIPCTGCAGGAQGRVGSSRGNCWVGLDGGRLYAWPPLGRVLFIVPTTLQ